jgi:hypothetical protein
MLLIWKMIFLQQLLDHITQIKKKRNVMVLVVLFLVEELTNVEQTNEELTNEELTNGELTNEEQINGEQINGEVINKKEALRITGSYL